MTEDDASKIVDLGQASFERFFTLACQFGFAEQARRRGLVPLLQYLMSPDRRSVEAYGCLCRRLPEAMLAPVYNEIFGVAHYGNKYADRQRLPLLTANVRKYVELAAQRHTAIQQS